MKNLNEKAKTIVSVIFYLIACWSVYMIFDTVLYYKEESFNNNGEYCWYNECFGVSNKDLTSPIVYLVTIFLNVCLFLKWDKRSWLLPIYNFKNKWLKRFYLLVSLFHIGTLIVILPVWVNYIYSTYGHDSPYKEFNSDFNLPYAPIVYGEFDGILSYYINLFLVFTWSWILFHAVIMLTKAWLSTLKSNHE